MQEIPSDAGDADTLILTPRKIADVITLSTESIEDAAGQRAGRRRAGDGPRSGRSARRDGVRRAAAATATSACRAAQCHVAGWASGTPTIDDVLDGVGAIQGHGGSPDTAFMNPAGA